MIRLKSLKNIASITFVFVTAITANVAKADCASDLYSCGKKAGTLGYELIENQAEMLAYIIEGTPCAVAIAAHDPATTVFSGAIVGLGALGKINNDKQGCKNDIYGVVTQPIAEIVDGIVPGHGYKNQIVGAGSSAVESLFYSIQIPSAIPNVGLQVDCGCHLLGIGAKTAESAREVAAAAAAAYKACGKTTKSCPGLKEALTAGKWVVGAAGDAVEFVGDTACKLTDGDGPAVNPQHMYQTHFEYMLSTQLDQDLADIPMNGSGHQNQFDAEMGFCTRHYDNRCQDGGRICTAIAQQTYNPAYYKILLEKMNGELFNNYKSNSSVNTSSANSKTCPGPAGISLSGDGSDTTTLLNDISKRCHEEVNGIISGSNGQTSLAQLARNNLPQTIDGPNGWQAKITTGKWITDSQKVYAEAIQLAQLVIKPLVGAVQDKYTQEYKAIADQGEVAMIPYDYLDKTYRGWTVFKLASAIEKCPAGLVNFKGHEKQCVSEMAEAFGYNLSAAVTKGEFQSLEQITGSALKGSAVYDITRGAFLSYLQQNKPVINIKNQTQEVKNEIAYNRAKAAWQSAGEPAASQAANNAIPQVLAQAGERQADVRTAQEAKIIDLQTRLKIPYDIYLLKCKSKQCQDDMYKKWVTLADKINAERTALQQVTPPNKAFDATKLDAIIKQYQKEITDIEPEFKSIVNSVSNQTSKLGVGVSSVDKLTKDKKLEALDKAGLKGNTESAPSLKDQMKNGNLGNDTGKTLSGSGDSPSVALPTIRGMRAAPGMVAVTPSGNKIPTSPAVQNRQPASVASLDETQQAMKDKAESQGLKNKPPSLNIGINSVTRPVAGAVEMPKPADNIGSGNLKDVASKPAANIGTSVAANAGFGNQRATGNTPPPVSSAPPVKVIGHNDPLAPAATPPFDRPQYQHVTRQKLEAKWAPKCKNETCKTDISALITKRINEVLRLLDTGTDLRNGVILSATEAKMDISYNPLMQAKVDASSQRAVENTPVTAPASTSPVDNVKNINSIKKPNF